MRRYNREMLPRQRTIARRTGVLHGVSLHSGRRVGISLSPAPPDSGIVFRRVDLDPAAEVRASAERVSDTRLATCVAFGRAQVSTIEHLMSALAALGIDNIEVAVDGDELPGMDGSAASFVLLLKNAGVVEQPAAKRMIRVEREVEVCRDDPANPKDPRRARLKPHPGMRYRVTIDFDHPYIAKTNQSASFEAGQDYEREVARARTFGFVRDIETLRDNGRALGGSFDNCVVLDDYRVLNEDGLRYDNEFARHKLLDAIGDCYVDGHFLIGEYEAHKPGHELNNTLMRALLADRKAWSWVGEEDAGPAPRAATPPLPGEAPAPA